MTRRCERPYDAEVEYLEVAEESGGAPYIDTGLVMTGKDYIMDIRLNVLGRGGTSQNGIILLNCPFESDKEKFGIRYAGGNGDVAVLAYLGCWNYTLLGGFANRTLNLKLDGFNNLATVSTYEKYKLKDEQGIVNTSPLVIFGPTEELRTFMRFYRLTITDETSTLIDLIPIRKGNTGYIYDHVSGRLFRNAGTGRFIVGPDVA